MWGIILVLGVAAVVAGGFQVARYFREGPEPDRGFAGSGPAQRLVAGALLTAAGLLLSFFGLANLVAQRAAAP
jgi:uncharacterized membrane protein HdeD (DUF308 family)